MKAKGQWRKNLLTRLEPLNSLICTVCVCALFPSFVPQKRGESLEEVLNNAELMSMTLQAHVVPDLELFTDDFVDGLPLPSLTGTGISIDEEGM